MLGQQLEPPTAGYEQRPRFAGHRAAQNRVLRRAAFRSVVGCDGSGAAPGGLERLRDLRSKGSTIATDHAERRERGAADTVLSELAGQDSLAVHAQLAEAAEALVDCSRALDLVVLRAGSPTGG